MGRGASWSEKECRVVAESWIAISEDPIKDTDQDSPQFWVAVLELYNKNRPGLIDLGHLKG